VPGKVQCIQQALTSSKLMTSNSYRLLSTGKQTNRTTPMSFQHHYFQTGTLEGVQRFLLGDFQENPKELA
jgi:hypothetical protein